MNLPSIEDRSRAVYTAARIVLASSLVILASRPASGARPESGGPVARDRPPLAVYRPVPPVPAEVVGLEGGALLQARLTVDAAGRVVSVAVLSIDPKGPFDMHYRREALRALRRWRFRPGLKDGQPAPAETSVSIRFERRERRPQGWRMAGVSLFEIDSERERQRLSILAMPEEARRAMREEIAGRAEGLLDLARRREVSSDHFTLITDLPEAQSARLLGSLESAWLFCEGILGPRIPLQPSASRILAFAFSERKPYAVLIGGLGPFERSAGLYHPAGIIAAHAEPAHLDEATVTMLHEAAHAFFDIRVVRPGVGLPLWLGEGLATYVGLQDGDAGEPPGRRVGSRPAGVRLKLADLIDATPAVFHGDQHSRYYSDSWRAVHFLRHGGDRWDSERFPRLILYLAEGYGFSESFRSAYGAAPEDLEESFRRHAAAL